MSLSLENDAPVDFDFIMGDWKVLHQRLNARFCNCDQWTTFESLSSTSKILGGFGNLEDNLLFFPTGTFRAVALRSYCRETGTWSIWWLDGRNPMGLDAPVRGNFKQGIGTFLGEDVMDGVPTLVRFIWNATSPEQPTWEQAFSQDGGQSWETNWRMVFTRTDL